MPRMDSNMVRSQRAHVTTSGVRTTSLYTGYVLQAGSNTAWSLDILLVILQV